MRIKIIVLFFLFFFVLSSFVGLSKAQVSVVDFADRDGVSASLNLVDGKVKLSKWNDLVSLEFGVSNLVGFVKEGDKYKLSYGEYAVYAYEVPEGFEYEIQVGKVPVSNVFVIPFSVEGLELWYQAPLNEELNLGDYSFVNATHAMVGDEVVVYRPENVVGSYAVYYSKSGNEFGTGKAFQIYRPLVRAVDGSVIWGTFSFDGVALSVTVDNDWLKKAKYPIVIDPTFGYTSVGASNTNGGGSTVKWGSQYTMGGTGGTLSSLKAYFYTDYSGSFTSAVYSDNSNAPNALLQVKTGTSVAEHTEWVTFSGYDISLSASTAYWLTFSRSAHYAEYYYDTATTYRCRSAADALPLADPFGAGTDTTNMRFSIYATYTESGGGTAYSFSLAESVGVSSSLVSQKGINKVSSGSFGVGSTLVNQKNIYRSGLEGCGVGSVFVVNKALYRGSTCTFTSTEVIDSNKGITVNSVDVVQSESGSVSDVLSLQKNMFGVFSGVVVVDDVFVLQRSLSGTLVTDILGVVGVSAEMLNSVLTTLVVNGSTDWVVVGLAVLMFMVLLCFVSLLAFGGVPIICYFVGLLTAVGGAYLAFTGIGDSSSVAGLFSWIGVLMGLFTMLLTAFGVRISMSGVSRRRR